jgi:hypothetical protein
MDLGLALCAGAVTCLAQPVMSRGQQQLPVNYAECLNRARQALQNVGFTVGGAGNFAQGFKDVSGAYIICNEIPGSGTVVNIVVATIANDAGVPGRLRELLQAQMERPGAALPPSGGGRSGGTAIKWSDYPLVASRGYDKNGQRFVYGCPPNGTPFSISGTDIYTDDSSICTAAVHAGLITFGSGGTVTVEVRRPGPNRYMGSSRNGVNSRGYDNGNNPTLGAFVFVR